MKRYCFIDDFIVVTDPMNRCRYMVYLVQNNK